MSISTNFPKRTLKSEKFHPFLCRIPVDNRPMPAVVAILFKNKSGIICSGQNHSLSQNLLLENDWRAPRPIWTTVSWNNNGDLAGFHWALAVTTGEYNGILVLSSPLHTYIYTINQYIHIYIYIYRIIPFGIYFNHVVETPETHKWDLGDNN